MFVGPNTITDGLILSLDFASKKSYPGSGDVVYNMNESLGEFSGSLNNGPTFSTDGGGSLEFDGSNDYIRLYKDDINPGVFSYDYCTIYVWVKPVTTGYNTGGKGANLITLENVVEISIGDRSNGFGKIYYASTPWSWRGSNSDMITNGEWNLITLTHSQSSRVVYVNGESVYTSTDTGTLGNGRTDKAWVTLMGRMDGTSSSGPGKLGLVRMYDSAHSQSQVQAEFNKYKTRFI